MGEKEMDERDFSIELKSNKYLTRLSTSSNDNNEVLIEGKIGKLEYASFVEPEILEVKGSFGVLRLNLAEKEILIKKCVGGETS